MQIEHFDNIPNSAEGIIFFLRQIAPAKNSSIEHYMGIMPGRINEWIEANGMQQDKFEQFKDVCEGFY